MRFVRATKVTTLTVAVLALLAVVLAACGGSSSREIHASEYASSGWRLTVESAELHCEEIGGGKAAIWVEYEEQHYPINPFATGILRDRGREVHDIEQIWRPLDPNAHILNSPINADALSLCGLP